MKVKLEDTDLLGWHQSLHQPQHHKLADVQDRIEKVAFDVVRFKDADSLDQLWKIESTEDGDVIVAMYNDELKAEASVKSDWQAIADSMANIHIYYKDVPVLKVASQSLGLKPDEVLGVSKGLPAKLASDSSLVKAMMLEVPLGRRFELFDKFPELQK